MVNCDIKSNLFNNLFQARGRSKATEPLWSLLIEPCQVYTPIKCDTYAKLQTSP